MPEITVSKEDLSRIEKSIAGKILNSDLTENVRDMVLAKLDLKSTIQSIFERIPRPKDGKDGKDAVISDEIVSMITISVINEVKNLIKDGKDGKDGRQGLQGIQGIPGRDGKDGESVVGPRGPQGLRGAQGLPGKDGKDGARGPKGERGPEGKPGKDGKGFSMDELDLSRYTTQEKVEKALKKEIADLEKKIRMGRIEVPYKHVSSGGLTGQLLINEISKSLGQELWKGPSQTLIDQVVQSLSTGVVFGFELSINSDNTKFDISSGCGYVVDNTTTPTSPSVAKVDYSGSSGNTVTNIATQLVTYISIDSSGGIIQETEIPDESDRRDRIFIGVLVHTDNATIEVVNNTPTLAIDTDAQLQDLMNSLGLFSIDGNSIRSFNGSLQITKTEGDIFRVGGNFQSDPKVPHRINLPAQNPVTDIQYRTQTGETYDPSGVLDPGFYDVGGTRTALSNSSKASNQRVYIFPSGFIRIQYGQTEYNGLSAAVEGISTETFVVESNLEENALLLCTISLLAGATDLSNADHARFVPAGKWGDVSNTGSTAVGTLQQIYKNSVTKPQIIIDSSLGAVELSDENDTALEVGRFGKISAGNYSAFEQDGTLVAKGDATVWKDINVGGVALTLAAANQPSKITIDGTNVITYGFSPTQTNELHGGFELQHDYKVGTDLFPHLHWMPVTAGAGSVVWLLEYYLRKGSQRITSTSQITIAAPGVAWMEMKNNFATIAGASLGISTQVIFRLARIGGDAADTYAANAAVLTFGVHYQVDTLGSRLITTK